MTLDDAITCATYLAHAEHYHFTIYRNIDNFWCIMNLGVAENAWPQDIKEVVGYIIYENDMTRFVSYEDRESIKYILDIALDCKTAKKEYESRSHIGSRFDWPE